MARVHGVARLRATAPRTRHRGAVVIAVLVVRAPAGGGVRARPARWPAHAPEEARWVRARIDAGLTLADILPALAHGEFKSS